MSGDHRAREDDGCPAGHTRDPLCQLTDVDTLTPADPEEGS